MAYASPADLVVHGLPATALGALTVAQQNAALDAASKIVDSKLRGRYALPLVAWGTEITQATCKIAAYELLNIRGYNPASGADVNVSDRYLAAMHWLDQVQRQAAHPDVTPQPSQTPNFNSPTVISSSMAVTGGLPTGSIAALNRGW